MAETCSTCRYADFSNRTSFTIPGECLRFPPDHKNRRPMVYKTDRWCGEWTAREAASLVEQGMTLPKEEYGQSAMWRQVGAAMRKAAGQEAALAADQESKP